MSKWILNYGIHQGTLMSRDVGQPTEYDSREEAMAAAAANREYYRQIGYKIWFATITDPNGKRTQIESNPYY